MTDNEIKNFCNLWSQANSAYLMGHLQFPEPLLKEITIKKFDNQLVKNKGVSPYDFVGNIELKSATKKGGVTPFKSTQNKCSRIIYAEFDDNLVTFYELSQKDVDAINDIVKDSKKKQVSICCEKYKNNAIKTFAIDLTNY